MATQVTTQQRPSWDRALTESAPGHRGGHRGSLPELDEGRDKGPKRFGPECLHSSTLSSKGRVRE